MTSSLPGAESSLTLLYAPEAVPDEGLLRAPEITGVLGRPPLRAVLPKSVPGSNTAPGLLGAAALAVLTVGGVLERERSRLGGELEERQTGGAPAHHSSSNPVSKQFSIHRPVQGRSFCTSLFDGMSKLDQLLQTETDRIEWKESDREALTAVCALANDLADSGETGWLVLGVNNSGQPIGIDTSDDAQQRLINRLRSTKILPHPSVDVEVHEREGKKLLVVAVKPYPVPPIVRVDQAAWVRVSLTTHRATEADLARLNERRPESSLPFDQRPLRAASLEDLDLSRLRQEHAAAVSTDSDVESFPGLERWLRQRDIARLDSGDWVPTAAGLLVFGLAPHGFIPGATIEFARFAGSDFDGPVASRKTIVGSLPDQLDALWTTLNVHLSDTLARAEGMVTLYSPEYPLEALRELARNLVQHRQYEDTHAPARVSWLDDRIVFSNPGGPFGRASEGELGSHSDYRNPTITRLLVEQGYVERLGRGIRLVRNQLARNGNPPLEVETDGHTTITVTRRA